MFRIVQLDIVCGRRNQGAEVRHPPTRTRTELISASASNALAVGVGPGVRNLATIAFGPSLPRLRQPRPQLQAHHRHPSAATMRGRNVLDCFPDDLKHLPSYVALPISSPSPAHLLIRAVYSQLHTVSSQFRQFFYLFDATFRVLVQQLVAPTRSPPNRLNRLNRLSLGYFGLSKTDACCLTYSPIPCSLHHALEYPCHNRPAM